MFFVVRILPVLTKFKCDVWYHPHCQDFFDAETDHFETFYCQRCLKTDKSLEIKYKKFMYDRLQNPFQFYDENNTDDPLSLVSNFDTGLTLIIRFY